MINRDMLDVINHMLAQNTEFTQREYSRLFETLLNYRKALQIVPPEIRWQYLGTNCQRDLELIFNQTPKPFTPFMVKQLECWCLQ